MVFSIYFLVVLIAFCITPLTSLFDIVALLKNDGLSLEICLLYLFKIS